MAPDEAGRERANRLANELVSISLGNDQTEQHQDKFNLNDKEQSVSLKEADKMHKLQMQPDSIKTSNDNNPLDRLNGGGGGGGGGKTKFKKYGACEFSVSSKNQKLVSQSGDYKTDQVAGGQMQVGLRRRSSSCGGLSSATISSLGANKLSFIERLAKLIPGLGIILALCASVFLGTAGMLVKLTTSVHGIQVAVFR